MKTTLVIFFTLAFLNSYSQDTSKIQEIDALVAKINISSLPVQRDTIIQDQSAMGIKMTTYLTMVATDKELLKYVNYVDGTRLDGGVQLQMTSSSTFYYEHNKLIKVEEFLIEAGIKKELNWYYWDDKPLYFTSELDNAESRATLLLQMSKSMLKQIIK